MNNICPNICSKRFIMPLFLTFYPIHLHHYTTKLIYYIFPFFYSIVKSFLKILYNILVIVAKRVDEQLQSKQALGLGGTIVLKPLLRIVLYRSSLRKSDPRYTLEKSALYRFKYFVTKPRSPGRPAAVYRQPHCTIRKPAFPPPDCFANARNDDSPDDSQLTIASPIAHY
jgi:hypothetical protein